MLRMHGCEVLEELGGDEIRVLHHGVRQHTGRSVLLKGPRAAQPSARLLAALRREHEIIRELSGTGAISGLPAVVAFDGNTGTLAIAFAGGTLLSQRLTMGRMPVDLCLKVALDLAVTIGELHRCKIVLKNLAPQGVIVGDENQGAQLVDSC